MRSHAMKGRRWLRGVRVAAVYLAAGAVATVAVAWGCGLWGTLDAGRAGGGFRRAGQGQRLPIEELGELAGMIDPTMRPPAPLREIAHAEITETPGLGLRESNLDLMYSPDAPSFRGFSVAALHRAGWPFLAMRAEWVNHGDPDGEYRWGLKPPRWLTRETYWVFPNGRKAGFRPPLPLLPEALGFAADTGVYGAALFVMVAGTREARRWRVRWRRKRNRCEACGYDLAGIGAGVCPECGGAAAGGT